MPFSKSDAVHYTSKAGKTALYVVKATTTKFGGRVLLGTTWGKEFWVDACKCELPSGERSDADKLALLELAMHHPAVCR